MSQQTPQQPIPAGWYPDPSPQNPGGTRWWDGARWTEHSRPGTQQGQQPVQQAAPQAQQPAPQVQQSHQQSAPPVPVPVPQRESYPPQPYDGYQTTQQQAYPAQPGYPVQSGYAAAPAFPPVPAGTSALTTWIWLVIGLPLVPAIVEVIFLPPAFVSYVTAIAGAASTAQDGQSGAAGFAEISPALTHYIVTMTALGLLGFVIYGLCVLFSYFDHRDLARRGVARPFHWAWAFLSGTVYVIGRIVVTNRRGAVQSFWPLWALIAVYLVSFVLAGIMMTVMFSEIGTQIGQLGGAYSGS